MQQPLCWPFLRVLGVILVLSLAVLAQTTSGSNPTAGSGASGNRGSHVIRGKIFLPSGRLPEQRMRVTLEVSTGGIYAETFSDSVGNFEFRSIPSSNYRVIVPTDGHTYETAQEAIEVSGTISRTYVTQLYLREKERDTRNSSHKMISAAAFEQNVPKAAKKPYEQGLKKMKDGKTEEAAALFQDALKLYPEYVLALNKLGETQAMLQKFTEAEATFQQSLTVSPKLPQTHISFGMMLVNLKRFPEAIEQFEIANNLDEDFPMAHLHLGIALLERKPQTENDLTRAEREFEKALAIGGPQLSYVHKLLFNLHLRRRNYPQAIMDLETYLKLNPAASDAAQVQEMLAKVKKATQPQPAKPQEH
ncbi:MAG: tetratricopeptide repeat protein [Blastocatellia bacterium]